MKFKFTFLFLVFFQLATFGQERYKILYDFQKEEILYLALDQNNRVIDTLKKPKFKKNSAVVIEVLNVNPFAVDVETDVSEENIHQNSGGGFNFGSLLGGIGSFSKENLNLNVGSLPISDTLFSRGARSRGANLDSKFRDQNDLATNVDALKTTLLANLQNPHLTKVEIENNIKAIASKHEDVRLPDPNENFYAYLSNLEKVAVAGNNEIIKDIKLLKSDLDRNKDTGVPSRGELVLRNTSHTELENLMQSVQTSTFQSVEAINEIETLYAALEGSTFSRTYDYHLDSDKSNIELKFRESVFASELEDNDIREILKTRNIKVFSRGGFKINTGIALTMNNFEGTSKDYYIDAGGQIAAGTNDYFVPNLSTMINFYPVISESFNFGGSFGLSVPISANVDGVNFLLGPSIFLGNESRLSLSGGVAYGPVERLNNGLKEGTSTTLTSLDAFTENVYDLGYFFGISFSLFDIN